MCRGVLAYCVSSGPGLCGGSCMAQCSMFVVHYCTGYNMHVRKCTYTCI